MNILLSYVSIPFTTAVYFERALRKNHNVFTVGPRMDESLLDAWNLGQFKGKIKNLDIPTTYSPDIASLVREFSVGNYPDLFLWIESDANHFPLNFQQLDCPKAALLIDTHINFERHLEIAKNFEYVFLVHRQFIPEFKKNGINNVFWLPVACDPEIHRKVETKKIFDVGFVGTVDGPLQQRRRDLLNKLSSQMNVHYRRCFLEEMADFFSKSKMVFNNSILNDLNMRLFEVLSTGTFLLTDLAVNSGQTEMFRDGEDLCVYNDTNIVELATFYLNNPEKMEKIARRGRQIVHNAHTYLHRAEEIIKVCSGTKSSTPSAEEWRELSLNSAETKYFHAVEIGNKDISINPSMKAGGKMNLLTRSFVIPVLDMSPASPYNITKLLDDLAGVAGNVIIIFNSVEMADKLKNHPRIDYYAIMSENVGVARAWNIGINMSETPVTFILNSDLHIEKSSVDQLEEYINKLDKAAIVGPQGSFFHFETSKDLHYFDKGSFSQPVEVDAVSGFYFAIKTEYFTSGSLHFENQFTPCYFEEWDLGLQIKQAGLKAYVVPVTAYDHEWSGSIRALRTIKYMKKEETAGEIHARNLDIFKNKWRKIKEKTDISPDVLVSLWIRYCHNMALHFIKTNNIDNALQIYSKVNEIYPGNLSILETLGNLEYKIGNLEKALSYFTAISELDPEYKVDLSKIDIAASKKEAQCLENPDVREYYENPRPEIQQIVNLSSSVILDVGCGAGLMAYELKQKLSAEVWGVEIVSSAAAKARLRLDKVIEGTIEANISNLPESYFDTIVFADVLEHLIDPESVLRKISAKLKSNGEIIASIPNVRYINVIRNLLQGFWEYDESGIMDKTHLRFFTRQSIIGMFSRAGMGIKDMYSARTHTPVFNENILLALNADGLDVSTLNDEAKDFQYIIRAVKNK